MAKARGITALSVTKIPKSFDKTIPTLYNKNVEPRRLPHIHTIQSVKHSFNFVSRLFGADGSLLFIADIICNLNYSPNDGQCPEQLLKCYVFHPLLTGFSSRESEVHTSYNKVTVKGTAASRVFFHLKAEAVRMGE
jgi:hypothetical protein